MNEMTTKQKRQRYGLSKAPHPATRVLTAPFTSKSGKDNFGGKETRKMIVINDVEGTFWTGNTYDGNLGPNFEVNETNTHPLPPEDSEKWKEWAGKGYVETPVSDCPALELIGSDEVDEATSEVEEEIGEELEV